MKQYLFIYLITIILCSCTTGGSDNSLAHSGPKKEQKSTPVSKKKPAAEQKFNYNIYIENSGSMDGYVQGLSGFQKSVYNIISDIKISGSTNQLNLYYVNRDTIPLFKNASLDQLKNFIEKLDPHSFLDQGGNRENTDLSQVISTATNDADAATVTVIVSDFIFSPGKNKDAKNYLVNQQIALKNLFYEKIAGLNISTLLLKFHSQFQGIYYDAENEKIDFSLTPIQRPFYALVIGPDAAVRDLLNQIDISKYKEKGFERLYYFQNNEANQSNNEAQNSKARARLTYLQKKGEFQIATPPSMQIVNADAEERENKRIFQFAVAVDYSSLVCDTDYVSNAANYEIFPPTYSLQCKPLNTQGDNSLKGYTHLLVLSTAGIKNSVDSISIRLKNKIPDWIRESSSENDKNILTDKSEQNKTFGFEYLMTGIKDAYEKQPRNKFLFQTNVFVSKAISGPSYSIWLLLAVILLISTFFYYKKSKSN